MIGTCMVYEMASGKAISETHPVRPASPYAASKLAGEYMAESYYHGFGMPVMILRPFNTYGPFQKSNMEGGVVSIFVKRDLDGQDLNIFGKGTQTRDLLYVEDCADFIFKASTNDKVLGQTFNAGTGKDISVNALAKMIASDPKRIKHVPHIHPQSEIPKLQCDPSKAMKVLKWRPKVSLEEGIKRLRAWFKEGN
jgi:nucleoside-diphosphate-sugar epimerase